MFEVLRDYWFLSVLIFIALLAYVNYYLNRSSFKQKFADSLSQLIVVAVGVNIALLQADYQKSRDQRERIQSLLRLLEVDIESRSSVAYQLRNEGHRDIKSLTRPLAAAELLIKDDYYPIHFSPLVYQAFSLNYSHVKYAFDELENNWNPDFGITDRVRVIDGIWGALHHVHMGACLQRKFLSGELDEEDYKHDVWNLARFNMASRDKNEFFEENMWVVGGISSVFKHIGETGCGRLGGLYTSD